MLNSKGNLRGLITRNILLTIIEKKCWYNCLKSIRKLDKNQNQFRSSINHEDENKLSVSSEEFMSHFDTYNDENENPHSTSNLSWRDI